MNLKHDIRQYFDRQSGFNHDYMIMDGGFVNKIVNLAMINLKDFTTDKWKLAVVKSQKHKYLLYNLSGRQEHILDSEVIMIVLEDENICYNADSLNLLAISLMFAAKCYSIDYEIIKDFDKAAVKQELCRGYGGSVLMLSCLGFSCGQSLNRYLSSNTSYESMVKEL